MSTDLWVGFNYNMWKWVWRQDFHRDCGKNISGPNGNGLSFAAFCPMVSMWQLLGKSDKNHKWLLAIFLHVLALQNTRVVVLYAWFRINPFHVKKRSGKHVLANFRGDFAGDVRFLNNTHIKFSERVHPLFLYGWWTLLHSRTDSVCLTLHTKPSHLSPSHRPSSQLNLYPNARLDIDLSNTVFNSSWC